MVSRILLADSSTLERLTSIVPVVHQFATIAASLTNSTLSRLRAHLGNLRNALIGRATRTGCLVISNLTYRWSDKVSTSVSTLQFATLCATDDVANERSTTEPPLCRTQVHALPTLRRDSPESSAHNWTASPLLFEVGFPHARDLALKSPRTKTFLGDSRPIAALTESRKISNSARLRFGEKYSPTIAYSRHSATT